MVSPHITAAAAEGAVAALCDENPDIREVFDINEDYPISESGVCQTTKAARHVTEDFEMKNVQPLSVCETSQESSVVPLALRYRAATATALGAAAARAKLLADQEDRELEYIMATIIENQLKKLQCKMRILNDVQQVMEKECALVAEQEDSIISERIDILKRVFDLGITNLRDHKSAKCQSSVVL
uniref:SMARCC C-terminal domain-containing protein n=1 Tax=Kalanchoe fedtschenkoi TaxID=63787 RepID=A0A7N0U7A8_KALFE